MLRRHMFCSLLCCFALAAQAGAELSVKRLHNTGRARPTLSWSPATWGDMFGVFEPLFSTSTPHNQRKQLDAWKKFRQILPPNVTVEQGAEKVEEEVEKTVEQTGKEAEKVEDEVENKVEETAAEAEKEINFERRKWLRLFSNRNFDEWAAFCIYIIIFLWVYQRFFIGLPSKTKYHGFAIVGWLGMGLLYNIYIRSRLGSEQAMVWLNGYLLELVFSLENVFVFHVIVESFGTPTVCTQKALFMIVCCQVVYELVLYMGLADVIDTCGALPYVLGAWLVYMGVHSAIESDDHSDFDILESSTVKALRRLLGDRLLLQYDDQSYFFKWARKPHMTMLGLVFCCLMMADFILEVDVTLTKIEQSRDEYLSFTSSAIAGFAVPELFFVARDLFRKFQMLKYGISFVLVFYGLEMLCPGVIELSPLEGCGIILIVMVLCILLSMLVSQRNDDSEGENSPCVPKSPVGTPTVFKIEDCPGDNEKPAQAQSKGWFAQTALKRNYSFVFDKSKR